MKNIKSDYEKWLYIIPFVIFWTAILQLSGTTTIMSMNSIKQIPPAAFYASVFYWLFAKYMWKWRIFQNWLVPYPNLEGTWTGQLVSTWINPETGKIIDPIPLQYCIHQDFENLYLTMFTKESDSYSQAAKFITEPDGSHWIKFTYTNKPKASVRHRSEIHEGAASLKIVDSPELSLHGNYWTSRKSTGDIVVTKKTDLLTDCFRHDLQ